ncbi:MAG TPA: hypothetical protein DCY13_08640 [Verrucomicrobiales bacterium]|nr:hypothetical protein [Verrucomicrobiales bacterium]
MSNGIAVPGFLLEMDFQFVSNNRDNLERLGVFLEARYAYQTTGVEKHGWRRWCLNGKTGEIPITEDILLHWALDMFDRGFNHDAELQGYGGLCDPKHLRHPELATPDEEMQFTRGMEAYERGNRIGALIAWTHVISINPSNDSAFYSRAIVRADLRNFHGAMQDYDRAIELDPVYWSAWENRACLRDDMGDHAGAITDHTHVIASVRDGSEAQTLAYANRGNAKLRLGDREGACADWNKAKELGAEDVQDRLDKYCVQSNCADG